MNMVTLTISLPATGTPADYQDALSLAMANETVRANLIGANAIARLLAAVNVAVAHSSGGSAGDRLPQPAPPVMTFLSAGPQPPAPMTLCWSGQYRCRAVIPNGATADAVVAACRAVGAVGYDREGVQEYVVVLREHVGPELWSEKALRKSIPATKDADEQS